MSPVVAVIHHNKPLLERIGKMLTRRGYHPVLWHGSGGAHAYIALRRPDLVVLGSPLENQEATLRILEELCWDPRTSDIPVILDAGTSDATPVGFAERAIHDLLALIDATVGDQTANERREEREAVLV